MYSIERKGETVIARIGAARAARRRRRFAASTCGRCGRAASTRCTSWWRPRRPKRAIVSMRSRSTCMPRSRAVRAMQWVFRAYDDGVAFRYRRAGRCGPDDAQRDVRRHRIHVRRRLRLHTASTSAAWIRATKASSIPSRRAASASTTPTICRWCAARRRTRSRSAKRTCATTAACTSAGAVTAGRACRRAFRAASTTVR